MKKQLKYTGLLLLLILLISCSSSKPQKKESTTQTVTIKETLHDTVFKIEKDSSFYQALLACQNGKVQLVNVTQAEPGRSLKSPRVRFENNKLYVDCELKEQELYAHWKSQEINRMELKTDVEYINRLTFWQKVQIWLGRIMIILLCFYCLKFSFKRYRL